MPHRCFQPTHIHSRQLSKKLSVSSTSMFNISQTDRVCALSGRRAREEHSPKLLLTPSLGTTDNSDQNDIVRLVDEKTLFGAGIWFAEHKSKPPFNVFDYRVYRPPYLRASKRYANGFRHFIRLTSEKTVRSKLSSKSKISPFFNTGTSNECFRNPNSLRKKSKKQHPDVQRNKPAVPTSLTNKGTIFLDPMGPNAKDVNDSVESEDDKQSSGPVIKNAISGLSDETREQQELLKNAFDIMERHALIHPRSPSLPTDLHRALSMQKSIDCLASNAIEALRQNTVDKITEEDLSFIADKLNDYYVYRKNNDKDIPLTKTHYFSKPQSLNSGSNDHFDSNEEALFLASVAIAIRRAIRTGIHQPEATKLMHALAQTGILRNLVLGILDNVTPVDSNGGKAVFSLLADASENATTRPAVEAIFKEFTTKLCNLINDVMKSSEYQPETRADAASIIKNISLDSHMRQELLSCDSNIIKLAESTLNETWPFLNRVIPITSKKTLVPTLAEETNRNAFSTQDSRISDDIKILKEHPEHFLKNTPYNELPSILTSCCQAGRIQTFVEANGHRVLGELLLMNQDDPELLAKCLTSCVEASEYNNELKWYLIEEIEPKLQTQNIAKDFQASKAYLDLMADCIVHKRTTGHGEDLVSEIRTLMNRVEDVSQQTDTHDRCDSQFKLKMDLLREIAPDGRAGLTLKEVHGRLVNRKLMKETLILIEARALRCLYNFIKETTAAYFATKIESAEAELGQEVMYGCLSIELFGEVPQNEMYLIESNLPSVLLESMLLQQNEFITQYGVMGAVSLCQRYSTMPTAFANVSNGPDTVAEIVRRARIATEYTKYWDTEDLLRPRLDLVREMAVDRQIFSKTRIAEDLIKLWNRTDRQFYGEIRFKTLESLQKAIKKERLGLRLEAIGNLLRLNKSNYDTDEKSCHTTNRKAVIRKGSALARTSSVRSIARYRRRSAATLRDQKSERRSVDVEDLGNNQNKSPEKPQQRQRGSSIPVAKIPHDVVSGESDLSSEDFFIGNEEDWNSDDDEEEGPVLMIDIMRTLRKVLHEEFISIMRKNAVPSRLLGLLIDRNTNPKIPPDVLFCIGSLAGNIKIKDDVGALKGVERILDLIRRAYQHDGPCVSEIVTNGCLALATLCISHGANTARFNRHRGTELVVSVLKKRGGLNDHCSVNGASALICNLCFKHEHMKQAFGSQGACEALVEALKQLRASNKSSGSRNIACLFKAIGNLALNGNNLQRFLQARIQDAFVDFMEQGTNELDDATLEACFTTIANLLIEKDSGEKFGVTIIPMLSLLRKAQKTSTAIYKWAFEVIGNLCRWPSNSVVLTQNGGIQTILSLLPHLADDPSLYASALFALGSQTSNLDNIPILIKEGILEFCKQVFQHHVEQISANEEQTELSKDIDEKNDTHEDSKKLPSPSIKPVISALRVIRRVLKAPEHVDRCIDSECFKLMLQLYHIGYSKPVLMHEILQTLFTMIYLKSDNSLNATGVTTQQKQPSASVKPLFSTRASIGFQKKKTKVALAAAQMRKNSILKFSGTNKHQKLSDLTGYTGYGDDDAPRDRVPLNERAWERLKLTDDDINELIKTTRRGLASTKAARDLRLIKIGIGLLTYFACEKKGFDGLFERLVFDEQEDASQPALKWDKQKRKTLAPTPSSVVKKNTENNSAAQKKEGLGKRMSLIALFTKKTFKEKDDELENAFGRERPPDITSVIDCVYNALDAFAKVDVNLVEESAMLLNHMILCAETITEVEAVADAKFHEELKRLARGNDTISNLLKPTLILYKVFMELGHHLTPEDVVQYYSLLDFEFPLNLSGWDDDPYPDGVFTLPPEVRDFLRQGGKMEAYTLGRSATGVAKPEKAELYWKASHDLMQFTWKTCKTKHNPTEDFVYPNSVAISAVRGVLPGINNSVFAAIRDKLSLSEAQCFNIIAANDNANLNIRAKSQSERDMFIHVFSIWRDAAVYGFR